MQFQLGFGRPWTSIKLYISEIHNLFHRESLKTFNSFGDLKIIFFGRSCKDMEIPKSFPNFIRIPPN